MSCLLAMTSNMAFFSSSSCWGQRSQLIIANIVCYFNSNFLFVFIGTLLFHLRDGKKILQNKYTSHNNHENMDISKNS